MEQDWSRGITSRHFLPKNSTRSLLPRKKRCQRFSPFLWSSSPFVVEYIVEEDEGSMPDQVKNCKINSIFEKRNWCPSSTLKQHFFPFFSRWLSYSAKILQKLYWSSDKKEKKEKQFCDNIAYLKTIIIAADLSSYWLLVLFTQNLQILFGRAIEGENEGRGRCRKWQHAKRRRRWGKRRRRGRRFNGVRMEKKETRTGQVLHEEKTRLSNLENKLIA